MIALKKHIILKILFILCSVVGYGQVTNSVLANGNWYKFAIDTTGIFKIDKSFLVFCHIKLIQHSKEFVTTFEREILKLEEVSECFHVSGVYDYILKVYVKDMDEYREFMVKKLTAIKHIGSTHSTFAIEEVKNTTLINL